MERKILIMLWSLLAWMFIQSTTFEYAAPKPKLSDYGFFTGKLSDLTPAAQLLPYEVVAPLFTDHAEKSRFIALPQGGKMHLLADGRLAVPEGTTVIKNFFYTHQNQRNIKETRLLIKQASNWKALTYIWADDQTDAHLEIAGADLPTTWHDANGKPHPFTYTVPNVNQCKGCHSVDGKFELLGVTGNQLNRDGQLQAWQAKGLLSMESSANIGPELVNYADASKPLNERARAYLHANCGHCHNPAGPASTSGLNLHIGETDALRLGVHKTPVAAGKGTGNRQYSILPGHPEKSIMLYRMESNDPGERMPELGRSLPDAAGIALIRDWIVQIAE